MKISVTCNKFIRSKYLLYRIYIYIYILNFLMEVSKTGISTEEVTMLTGFPRTRWPRLRFSESYAVRISVKISQICEFRVIMGIMTGLLGCCSSSTLGIRAKDDYVKTLARLGFWLHHSSCSLGCMPTIGHSCTSDHSVHRLLIYELLNCQKKKKLLFKLK